MLFRSGRRDALKLLTSRGGSIDAESAVQAQHYTALTQVALADRSDAVECLLDCGACNTCPADFASTVVGSVDASGCKPANCQADEYVGVDGTCTAMVAQCDSLACGTGFVLKSDAASRSCANYPCDVATDDKATCCEETTCIAKDADAWAALGCAVDNPTATNVGGLGNVSPAAGYSLCIVACVAGSAR